ncbi:hypothetical protein DITRI_Ditri11bG0098600 [Diplodiscus trichospermus]
MIPTTDLAREIPTSSKTINLNSQPSIVKKVPKPRKIVESNLSIPENQPSKSPSTQKASTSNTIQTLAGSISSARTQSINPPQIKNSSTILIPGPTILDPKKHIVLTPVDNNNNIITPFGFTYHNNPLSGPFAIHNQPILINNLNPKPPDRISLPQATQLDSRPDIERDTVESSEQLTSNLGAASAEFKRAFDTLSRNYKPDIMALLEPSISGKRADDFIKKSGFQWSHRTEPQVAYGSPVASKCKMLWDGLSCITNQMRDPWIVGGDFNAILHNSEKKGGASTNSAVCKLFKSWFEEYNMCDLRYHGPNFTWLRGLLMKRLDCFICNDQWYMNPTYSSVIHLPNIQSDHHPILVRYGRKREFNGENKPFRFLAPWLTHPNFKNFVETTWENGVGFIEALKDFVEKVQVWNRDVFGNIFKRKRVLLARLGGIQKALESHGYKSLRKLEKQLSMKLEEVMLQEEILWQQKSKKD